MANLLLENVYYLQNEQVKKLKNPFYEQLELEKEVKKYYGLIIESDYEQKQKLKASLYLIYNWAIHDNYYEAKDMLIMSRISDIIQY